MDIVAKARRAVDRTPVVGGRRRYRPKTIELVAQAARMMRSRGDSWGRISKLLKVSAACMFRWDPKVQVTPAIESTPTLVPVRVVPHGLEPKSESASRHISISLPSGLRAEGLTVGDLLAVLAAS